MRSQVKPLHKNDLRIDDSTEARDPSDQKPLFFYEVQKMSVYAPCAIASFTMGIINKGGK